MKIAIATFGTRVSPRFDCAPAIAIVTVGEGRPSERLDLAAADWPSHERIHRLAELGVDTVICGGIDRWTTMGLQAAGVTIYGWVTGEVHDALAALLRGDLDAQAAARPRGRCRCRRFAADGGTGGTQPGPTRDPKRHGGGGRRHRRARPPGA